jgi:2-oxoglutarate dehydrogenase E1 component
VVANLSTPAQYFHALRRQKKKEYAKPLVLMSPKSLLRHKSCVSMLKDLTHGEFQDFLPDPIPAKKTETLVLCSGKVYYDLIEARESIRTPKATIIRIEQFYPFNQSQFLKTIEPFTHAKRIVWCQEEPQNMGAWSFLSPIFEELLGKKVEYVGRTSTASPATGSLTLHKKEQFELVANALGQSLPITEK